MRYPSIHRTLVAGWGLSALAGLALLAGCAASKSGGASAAEQEVFPTYQAAVLRDLKPGFDSDATLLARANDPRRQMASVPSHGCQFIIQPLTPPVPMDGPHASPDSANGDTAWTVILHSVYGDWRIIGAGTGWLPQESPSNTRGWPDLVTGNTLREGVATVSLLQYDGRHYRPGAAAAASSGLCSWAEQIGAVPHDLAAAILRDTTGLATTKVQDAPGLAFITSGPQGASPLVLVSLDLIVADDHSFDLVHQGDNSANVFLYARLSGGWVKLGSVLTKQLVCCPEYDPGPQTWLMTTQTGGTLAQPVLEEVRFPAGGVAGHPTQAVAPAR